jgi:hypothetical protein
MNLDHHAFLASVGISDFRDSVARSTNFKEDFALDRACDRRNHQLRVFGIASGTTSKVGLVLLALRMGKI